MDIFRKVTNTIHQADRTASEAKHAADTAKRLSGATPHATSSHSSSSSSSHASDHNAAQQGYPAQGYPPPQQQQQQQQGPAQGYPQQPAPQGYAQQPAPQGYAPQGYAQQPAPQGYAAGQGYPAPQGYAAGQGYPAPAGYAAGQGYAQPPPQGYAQQPAPQGYAGQGYPQQPSGYAAGQGYPQQPAPPDYAGQGQPQQQAAAGLFREHMNLAEFEAAFNLEARTPEGCVKCLVVAAYEWFGNKNPDGAKMYALCLPKDQVNAHGEPSRGTFTDQFGKKAGSSISHGTTKAPIPASYLGGTPQNHYTPDYSYRVYDDTSYGGVRHRTETEAKIFVRSGGKDFASPVVLKRNNAGLWKVFEYSSLYTGIKDDSDKGDF